MGDRKDTRFAEGHPRVGGRVKGTPNKITVAVKDALLQAFDRVGGVDYLVKVAADDPKTFCTLLGRLVPTQLHAEMDIRSGLADLLAAARARTKGGG